MSKDPAVCKVGQLLPRPLGASGDLQKHGNINLLALVFLDDALQHSLQLLTKKHLSKCYHTLETIRRRLQIFWRAASAFCIYLPAAWKHLPIRPYATRRCPRTQPWSGICPAPVRHRLRPRSSRTNWTIPLRRTALQTKLPKPSAPWCWSHVGSRRRARPLSRWPCHRAMP